MLFDRVAHYVTDHVKKCCKCGYEDSVIAKIHFRLPKDIIEAYKSRGEKKPDNIDLNIAACEHLRETAIVLINEGEYQFPFSTLDKISDEMSKNFEGKPMCFGFPEGVKAYCTDCYCNEVFHTDKPKNPEIYESFMGYNLSEIRNKFAKKHNCDLN